MSGIPIWSSSRVWGVAMILNSCLIDSGFRCNFGRKSLPAGSKNKIIHKAEG
jgi:hypothetical protein